MPDNNNPFINAIELKIGKFNFYNPDVLLNKELAESGPCSFEDGTAYMGQLNKDGLRHGKGL